MNVLSRNNNTQLVEWINNVTMTATDFGSFVEMTIMGRFTSGATDGVPFVDGGEPMMIKEPDRSDSLWYSTAEPAPEAALFTGNAVADAAIIGGVYTGCSAGAVRAGMRAWSLWVCGSTPTS